jgi:hypothetical protein
MKMFILIIFLLNYSLSLSANEVKCKKFDIKCKTSSYIKDTVEFQKKSLKSAKELRKGNKKK